MVWYNVYAILGFLVGTIVLIREFKLNQLPVRSAVGLAATIFIVSRVGAYLAYSLETGVWREHWYDYFAFDKGGMSLLGGFYLAVATTFLFARHLRRPWLHLLDLLAPAVAFAFAVGRFGCLTAGCCRGFLLPDYATLPDWFPNNHLFPAPLLHSVVNAAIGVYLLKMPPSPVQTGRRAGMFLLLYSLSRFFIEFLRNNHPVWHNLTMAQLLAIPAFLAGLWLVARPRTPENTTAEVKL